ncbi:replication initiator [Streptomyces tricolor]
MAARAAPASSKKHFLTGTSIHTDSNTGSLILSCPLRGDKYQLSRRRASSDTYQSTSDNEPLPLRKLPHRGRPGPGHGPLVPERYDYAGAVLWNNYAGDLWRRFTIYLRREIAARTGLTQTALREVCRVTFGKVAQFQKRGSVHFHAAVRLDGPDSAPPAWAMVALLDGAIRAAAARVSIPVPTSGDHPARVLRWGSQVDVQAIGALGQAELKEQAVASYVAKYATKAADTTDTVDHRIGELAELDKLPLPAHTRRLIGACWGLDDAYPERLLARWAHMLGFRGHFSTKSRRYSTTLGALRQVRADYRARQERRERGLSEDLDDTEGSTLVLAHWTYAGQGHTPGESWLAATIARAIRLNRETAREALQEELARKEPQHDHSTR